MRRTLRTSSKRVDPAVRVERTCPAKLRDLQCWLLWKSIDGGKIPYYISGKRRQGVLDTPKDRKELVNLARAIHAYRARKGYAGLAIALGPYGKLVVSGIDLDNCLGGDGQPTTTAQRVIKAAKSYTEISPSGKGVKIFGLGNIGTKGAGGGLEIYSGRRFFAFTGRQFGEPTELRDLTHAAALARRVFGEIPEGSRNNALFDYARSLRDSGERFDSALAKAREYNGNHCAPPLSETEILRTVRSAFSRDPQGATQTWVPPLVHSYGEGFDPKAIPLRQWLLGHRRSRSEVTVDVGPPGVNKSTLLITDAIALASGRQLLADEVHIPGDVLLLAGEETRRDVEARIAAVLEWHQMDPADLGGRLHVVYLSEVDPLPYSLAQMIDSTAVVNRQMLDWISAYPGLVAAFIDPIAAWHYVLENDTGAMKTLATELRRMAVMGKIHVGFDHHTTKASQGDREMHVGSLVATRGAYLAADARWMFTLSKIKEETAEQYGVPQEERALWRRLDALKASYGPDMGTPRLLKVETVAIANGEEVAVLTEPDTSTLIQRAAHRRCQEKIDRRNAIGEALTAMLTERRPRSLTQAAAWMGQNRPDLYLCRGKPLSTKRLGEQLAKDIGAGLAIAWRGRPAQIVYEQTGEGHATRWTIVVAHEGNRDG